METQFTRQFLTAAIAAMILITTQMVAQKVSDAELRYRDALHKQQVEGDLNGAIILYQNILDSKTADRPTKARALLQLAGCYEALGRRAESLYQQLVRDFADQPPAREAAEKLAALRSPSRVPVTRSAGGPICTGCVGPRVHGFSISPDGRWVSYQDRGVMIRNVETGEVKPLFANTPGTYIVWSPDSRQIVCACSLDGRANQAARLQVVSVEPGSPPRTLVENPDINYVFPEAWSPDGKSILVKIRRADFTWQLAWVSVTGDLTILKSLNWQFNEFHNGPDLSPDGRHIVYSTFATNRTSEPRAEFVGEQHIHILAADGSQDVILPTIAYGYSSPVWSSDGKQILFISDRDGSGSYDLYQVAVRDGKPVGLPSLIRTSIGGRVDLLGVRSGTLYYVRPESFSRRITVRDVKSGAGTPSAGPTLSFAGSFPAWSPDGNRVAWIRLDADQWLVRARSTLTDRTILVIHPVEGDRDRTYSLPPGAILGGPHWTSDGAAVLLGIVDGETAAGRGLAVVRVDLKSSEIRQIGTYFPATGEGWDRDSFTVSADAKTIYLRDTPENAPSRVVAIDIATGRTSHAAPGVTGVQRIVENIQQLAGQNRVVRPSLAWSLGLTPMRDGSVAVNLMKDQGAYLATMNADGSNYREFYGAVAGRLLEGVMASRLSNPKPLLPGLGFAFGVQQEDFSWKLLRVTEDGRSVPLDPTAPAQEFTLEPGALQFDISPDGKQIAYERMMSFSNELWALDLSSLNKPR